MLGMTVLAAGGPHPTPQGAPHAHRAPRAILGPLAGPAAYACQPAPLLHPPVLQSSPCETARLAAAPVPMLRGEG